MARNAAAKNAAKEPKDVAEPSLTASNKVVQDVPLGP